MSEWTNQLRERLARLRLRPEREAEIIEELSQHLDQRYEELRSIGSSDADARRLAMDELMEHDALANRMRPLRQAHVPKPIALGEPKRSIFDGLWQDLRYAFRMLRKQPGFAVTAALTLALGIGANSAIFTLVDATLLRPLPFDTPDRLVMMWEQTDSTTQGVVSPLNMFDWMARSRSFASIGAFIPSVGGMVMTGADGTAETVGRQWVTYSIFDALGIKPIVGRTFTPADDRQQVNAFVISESFWRSRFGGDPGVVGGSYRLDGEAFTLLGVVPDEAQLIGRVSMWAVRSIPPLPALRARYMFQVVGRLKPGVTLQAAGAEMKTVAAGLAREFPETNKGRSVALEPMRDFLIGSDLRLTSLLFLGVVGFVLLICCANVASLLLARASVRGRELAIRSALGADRRRVIRQLLTESLVLSLIGGVLGIAMGAAILQAAPSVIPADLLPGAVSLTFDVRVVALCALIALVVGLLFGLAPAWQATGFAGSNAAASESRTVTGQGRRLRGMLVVAEVSTAVLLLFGAGLLLRTLVAVDSVDRGYRQDQVLSMMVDPLGDKYPTPASLLQFFDEIERETKAVPGLRSVAWSSALPLQPADENPSPFEIAGAAPVEESKRPLANYQIVSPSYFQTVDLPIIAGRSFDERDTPTGVPVCIVSEAFVRHHLQGREPVGAQIVFRQARSSPQAAPAVRQIVGVARQVKSRPDETEALAQIYVPLTQRPVDDIYLLVRPASGDAAALAPSVRAAINRVDKEQLVSVRNVVTLEDIASDATSRHRFRALLVTTFAGLSLLLAMVGVFGLLSYSVQQRVREIGVRRALGATTGGVARLIAEGAGRLIATGVVIGLTLAVIFGRWLVTMLFGVQALDPITFGGVAIMLVIAAAVATAVPVWRAVHVEPVTALRSE